MTAIIVDITGIRARRNIREAVRQVRCESSREVARIHRETEAKRARIEAHLNRIENDVDWRRPTDLEVPFA